ncbi:MAG: hypothetical protein LC792_27535, partial [Actinobacteria bacterium]|nr:hypothetical protein [Actinomycetota bacterium]
AREVATRHLEANQKLDPKYDVIFCTSDSMTLGCMDAIDRLLDEGLSVPPIVGYDGIAITQHVACVRPDRIARVVVQDTHELAVATARTLRRMIHAPDSPTSPQVLIPSLYPSVSLFEASGRRTKLDLR